MQLLLELCLDLVVILVDVDQRWQRDKKDDDDDNNRDQDTG